MPEDEIKARVLNAALSHVPFDGWSEATLKAAITQSGVAPALARALFPRGGVDLALAYHQRGDDAMATQLAKLDLKNVAFRDRVAKAVRTRLELSDKELARRGTTLFALPIHAADGARAIWGTADRIWTALGDKSQDFSWYSKRATLSGVYASTVLFWLGDDSPGQHDTWEFLDRRIEEVMQFGSLTKRLQENRLGEAMMRGPGKILESIRAPRLPSDLPGWIRR
ncbi:COQ9 family protein [Tabrizicola sp.]|uniref:COQ9 family protein n=1 Tax=Tabrizicola sp. TaxID=2005166 RepID=UPI002732315D|nr:COQ9 family protein [Tabrizicola sp.]MDP3194064.1 COQ9 family protein [Tabrizicola sp.]